MNIKYIILVFVSFLSSCMSQNFQYLNHKAKSTIINNNGKIIGDAIYTQGSQGVLINIKIYNLPKGKHGMHFHKRGTCKDYSNFKLSEGHIMKDSKPHGFLNPKGPHAGNLPNLVIGENNKTEVEIYTQLVSLYKKNRKKALIDQDGSSLIIHQNQDDHLTQPIGNSGNRIACGVIKPIEI